MTLAVLRFIDRCQKLIGSDVMAGKAEFRSALRLALTQIPEAGDRREELVMKSVLAEVLVRCEPGIAVPGIAALFASDWGDRIVQLVGPPRGEGANRNAVSKPVRAALTFVRERYSDPRLSLEAAAAAACVSSCHLSHLVRQQTGLTFSAHVFECRVLKAENLLRTTDMPVKRIAIDVGYLYTNDLDRNFRRRYGHSPTSYRRLFSRA